MNQRALRLTTDTPLRAVIYLRQSIHRDDSISLAAARHR